MNDAAVTADASAILALLKGEQFGEFAPRRLFRATIIAVNLSEIPERLCSGGLTRSEAEEAVAEAKLTVTDFDEARARLAAYLRPQTRHAGLSFGDCACLALGLRLGCQVITADRAGTRVNLGMEIVLIR